MAEFRRGVFVNSQVSEGLRIVGEVWARRRAS